jgi:hypothetical protein
MKKSELKQIIKEEIRGVLSEVDMSLRQKINKFVKEMRALGASEFYINPIVKGSNKYLRKFYVNTTNDQKDWSTVKKWIMSQPEAHKNVGIGVDNYSYSDNQNKLNYHGYSHSGYYYLSIEPKS